MNESPWTREACKYLEKRGAKTFPVVAGNPMQPSGWPDRFLAHKFWSGWAEFKNPKTPLELNQRAVLQDLSDRDCPNIVIRRTQMKKDLANEVLILEDYCDNELGRCTLDTLFETLNDIWSD